MAKKKTSRAGVRPAKATARATATTNKQGRKAADSVRRRRQLRPPPFEVWGTIARRVANKLQDGTEWPSVCIWGEQETAFEGKDVDEYVCLVRVEVLEVLDE